MDKKTRTLRVSSPREEFEQFVIAQILELKIAAHVNTYLLSRLLERIEGQSGADATEELRLIQQAVMDNMEQQLADYTVMPESLRRLMEQVLQRPPPDPDEGDADEGEDDAAAGPGGP